MNLFPCTQWARSYNKTDALNDGLAALIVTLMLVPQSLAYAMLAGLQPHVGLYASILPLIAYAVFGTSRTLAVGPVAVISLMSAAAAGQVAAIGSADFLSASIMLALLSGAILLVMAILRLGFLANILSHPVISGFITASGLLITASQLKHILGVKAEGETLPHLVIGLWDAKAQINLATLLIGALSLAFLFWVRKRAKPTLIRLGLPPRLADLLAKTGPVAAIISSVAMVQGFGLDEKGVKLVGVIPQGLPPFGLPTLDLALIRQLAPSALLIALVGFVESVSVAQTLAAKRRQCINANQELVALGVANLASALSGGYSVTGGFARSVVNFEAGAVTPLAGALTAVGILLATLFFTPFFMLLPQAVLAATIIVAVLSLVDFTALKRAFAYSRFDFAAQLTTITVVLMIGVETGILAGITLSLLLFFWRTARPHVAVVGLVAGTEHFRNVERHAVETHPYILSLRIDESLYFANSRFLEDTVYSAIAERPALKHVILMCPAVNIIDLSALEALEAIAQRMDELGLGFHLSEVKGPVMDALKRSDFFKHFKGRVFLSQFEAVEALKSHHDWRG